MVKHLFFRPKDSSDPAYAAHMSIDARAYNPNSTVDSLLINRWRTSPVDASGKMIRSSWLLR
jgi:hypothetical protein